MPWSVQELPAHILVALGVASVIAAIIRITWSSKPHHLDAFPTVGSSGLWGGIKSITHAAEIAGEGYRKYRDAPFKISTLYYWAVVLSSRAHIEEVRNARDEDLSFLEPTFEDLNSEYTMGSEVNDNPYHIIVVRSHLTRHLDVMFPAIRDEIMTAFDEILDLKGDEWKSVPTLTTMQDIVSRTSNRAFVGLPLCRDPDFVDLNIQFTLNVILDGTTIGFFPKLLKPFAARFITSVRKNIKRGVEHLRPIVEERRRYMKEYGKNWSEKPADLLTWLLEEMGLDASIESITNYVLSTNFAAIHTSSNVFTIALFNLAMNPQCVQPLREEVETIIEKEGWSKASVSKMLKIDSFLKETLRKDSILTLGMARKARKDYRFSDGTLIPKGTRIAFPFEAVHYDEAIYEKPKEFDAFRFTNLGEKSGDNANYQLVSTSPEYLPFGHGRHSCPGRHFAAVELKTMLAYVVTTYDIKLESDVPPKSFYIGTSIRADSSAKVMFRKRARQGQSQTR